MKLTLSTQVKQLFPTIIKLYTLAIVLLIFVVAINYKTDIDIGIFTRDPAVTAGFNGLSSTVELEANPFLGIISNVGILCWCICTSVCFFSSAILKNYTNLTSSKDKILVGFLQYFAIVSLILLLDDLFLFHEIIAPKLLYIPENTIYFCYSSIILWAMIKYRKIILTTEWLLLLLAFLFLGCSVLIDSFLEYFASWQSLADGLQILLEDGFKLLGIVSWVGYFTRVCFQTMNNKIKTKLTSQRDRFISRKKTAPISLIS